MKKAVAIPYIIALVLGVAVIVLLGYWFINQSGKTTNTGISVECQGRIFSFCNQWFINDVKPTSFDFGKCTKEGTTQTLTVSDIDATKCKNVGITVG